MKKSLRDISSAVAVVSGGVALLQRRESLLSSSRQPVRWNGRSWGIFIIYVVGHPKAYGIYSLALSQLCHLTCSFEEDFASPSSIHHVYVWRGFAWMHFD